MKREIAILGGGSWGTVLANLASINGNKVTLWMRDEANIKSINETNLNTKYLPDYLLTENLTASTSSQEIRTRRFILI